MDPCPFVRLTVKSLALQLRSSATRPSGSGVHPSSTPCYAKLKLKNLSQTALLHLHSPESSTGAYTFDLDSDALRSTLTLKVSVFTGRTGRACGITSGKLLGSVQVSLDQLGNARSRACVYHNGWMKLGGGVRIHMTVRSEPDPRYVFQFGGEPECSPVVFQIQQGNIRQPVFSCKFTAADGNNRSRSLPSNFNTNNKGWIRSLSREKERVGRERKGWMITVYDLSGSAVAAASMITPFVPSSPGSDRVSRSNPGAWLILRPNGVSISSWKPWGRLEAWRERGPIGGLGYKFELVTDTALTSGISIAEGTISVKKGGRFCIDNSRNDQTILSTLMSPVRGFVIGSSIEGEGKVSKPVVEVGVMHVTCIADAALFVALSAAMDLSMDACRLFSHKLRKEFSSDQQEIFT